MSCDEEANEFIAQYLIDERGYAEEEVRNVQEMCSDGKRRNLWRVPPQAIRKFVRAKRKFPNWKFNFFVKSSAGALPSGTDIFTRGKVRLSKKDREMLDTLGTQPVDKEGFPIKRNQKPEEYPQF